MDPYQQGNDGNFGEDAIHGLGDWAQAAPSQGSQDILDPQLIQDDSTANSYSAGSHPPGICPGRTLHTQLMATYIGGGDPRHGMSSSATMQSHNVHPRSQPINIGQTAGIPALMFSTIMEPDDFMQVPGLSYANSAPSVMSSDHSGHVPMQYMYGDTLVPPFQSYTGNRVRFPELESDPRLAKETIQQVVRSGASAQGRTRRTLQPPAAVNPRRASDPGDKRPISAIQRNKRKRDAEVPRIGCQHCEQTFKMPADRERHVKVSHPKVAMISTVWVCRYKDIQIPGGFKRWIGLDKCKSCQQGKRYNASHNAEEHLRRKHFYPRIPGSKPRNESERRGGKGGGKDPDVQYLKDHWIEKIDICHKQPCPCAFRHEPLPDPDTDRRRGSRSSGPTLDVDIADDGSEASSYAHSNLSISPNVMDNQAFEGLAITANMWGDHAPTGQQSSFGYASSQPSSFSSNAGLQQTQSMQFFRGRPALATSSQHSRSSLSGSLYTPDDTQQEHMEFSPATDDFPYF